MTCILPRHVVQLMARLRPDRIAKWLGNVYRCRLGLSRALPLILLSIELNGCESARPYERVSDGSTVYLDQLSAAEKVEARQKIVNGLRRGVEVYDLGVGDEVDIFFHISRKPTSREYTISVSDKLRIEFLG